MFRPRFALIALLVFVSTPLVQAAFNDVPSSHPDYEAINYLQAQGFVSGSEDGLFHPELGLTRCELTKIALKTAGITLVTPATSSFPDVSTTNWCHPYAYTARSHGILNGYPDGTFKPNRTVTEIEALKIILNSLSTQLPSVTQQRYIDVKTTDWWAPYIEYVRTYNLSTMPSSDYYGIQNEFLRAKMARVLYRGLTVQQTGQPFPEDFASSLDDLDSALADLDNTDFDSWGI